MIIQGQAEQSPWTAGCGRNNMKNSDRILEKNTENLLRMVTVVKCFAVVLCLLIVYPSILTYCVLKYDYSCFRSVILKMMSIADVSYSFCILEKSLILETVGIHVIIVRRSKL